MYTSIFYPNFYISWFHFLFCHYIYTYYLFFLVLQDILSSICRQKMCYFPILKLTSNATVPFCTIIYYLRQMKDLFSSSSILFSQRNSLMPPTINSTRENMLRPPNILFISPSNLSSISREYTAPKHQINCMMGTIIKIITTVRTVLFNFDVVSQNDKVFLFTACNSRTFRCKSSN